MEGMHQWKLEAVLNIYPLLLQVSLLLFTAALTINLWQTGLVLAIGALGALSYAFAVITALISPDAPFRTPRTDQLSAVLSAIRRPVATSATSLLGPYTRLARTFHPGWSKLRRLLGSGPEILPFFWTNNHLDVPPKTLEADGLFPRNLPSSAPAVPAIVWVLETSSDPAVIGSAASMAVDLQWPLDLDLYSPLVRLQQTFMQCFTIRSSDHFMRIRPGFLVQAIRCGLALGTLNLYTDDLNPGFFLRPFKLILPGSGDNNARINDLRAIFDALSGSMDCVNGVLTPSVFTWVLRIVPWILNQSGVRSDLDLSRFIERLDSKEITTLERSTYVDYLLCITSFLGFQPPRRLIQRRDHRNFLLAKLFQTLAMRVAKNDIELALVEKIVKTTMQLADDGVESDGTLGPDAHLGLRLAEIYRFCGNLPRFDGWINLALSALVLAKILSNHLIFQPKSLHIHATSGDLGWVYEMLEHLQASKGQQKWDENTCSSVEDLLQVLVYSNPPLKPNEMALRVLVRSLSMTRSRVSLRAFHILHRFITKTESFLRDRDSWTIMHAEAFWPLAGQLVRNNGSQLGDAYVEMGYTLSGISDWQPVIYHKLALWIDVFYNRRSELQTTATRDKFTVPHMGGGFDWIAF
ncbi:hypothetical protein FB451DRAFT_1554825 [Mycena latifolia]|nr:hypothetical protein FB451DRAFT_1554825 [Mycena latifolia]